MDIGHSLLDIGHSLRVLRYAQEDKLRFVQLLKLEIDMEAARESKNARLNASLDIGHSLLDIGYSLQDIGYSLQDIGHSLQDIGH